MSFEFLAPSGRARRTRTSRACRTGAHGRCRACPCRRRRPRAGSRWRSPRSAAAARWRRGSRRGERCERHLRGPGQIQIVVREPVELLFGVGQHARADQRALAHEHRRDHGLEVLLEQLRQRVLDERELEQHDPTAQIGKARSRQGSAALHVDHRSGQLEVVTPGAAGLAHLPASTVSARGASCGGHVRQPEQQLVEIAADARLDFGQLASRARRAPPSAHAPRCFRRSPPALARAVLLGAQVLELHGQAAPAARRARARGRSHRRPHRRDARARCVWRRVRF